MRGVYMDLSSRKQITNNWQLYLMLFLPLLFLVIFLYLPMFGVVIAFKNYRPLKGIMGSDWVGLKHFFVFFKSYQFKRVLLNTLRISLYSLVAGFPIPIIFALSLNYIKNRNYKKTIQTVVYAPYFISTVVIVSMITQFFSPRCGFIAAILSSIVGHPVDLLSMPQFFDDLYVWSGVWQSIGFNSIIYIACLSGVNTELHEAAIVDGATKFKRILNIDLPHILPTAIVLLILNLGQILNVGYEKVFLMQNPLSLSHSEIISTYVYKVGLESNIPQYSYSAAIGLFQSIVGLVLITIVNKIANKLGDKGLW